MKFDKKDVPQFKDEVCTKCHCLEYCQEKEVQWFLACPKFFNWKIGYVSPFETEAYVKKEKE